MGVVQGSNELGGCSRRSVSCQCGDRSDYRLSICSPLSKPRRIAKSALEEPGRSTPCMGCKGSSVRITPSRPFIVQKSKSLAVLGFFYACVFVHPRTLPPLFAPPRFSAFEQHPRPLLAAGLLRPTASGVAMQHPAIRSTATPHAYSFFPCTHPTFTRFGDHVFY